jgi:phosphopantothenoylcysteine decarboxylase/phosphopantothenate--cysteine ligase
VTGCIGAYKSAVILRFLQKAGFEVFPVMTRHAQEFIAPLTLEKLSGNKVVSGLFSDHTTQIEHIDLARKSDLLLVAPATANILAKFAHGIADDFLSTLYLSTLTPVVVAPAMNVEMWRHPGTRGNLRLLRKRNVVIVEPDSGYLACGEEGEGRLAEPEAVVQEILSTLRREKSLLGRRVLVTAGPTIEDIDLVRFVSNRSSGKMGYAVATEAQQRGARVTLVSGPTHLPEPQGVELIRVRSAEEMAETVVQHFREAEVVVMAAAVSDFAPAEAVPDKLKKREVDPVIRLRMTSDILRELGGKKEDQFLVGFAAESDELHQNASRKLQEKNLNLIVANDISEADKGFQSNYNQVLFLDRRGRSEESPVLHKSEIARLLWDRIEEALSSSEWRSPSADYA